MSREHQSIPSKISSNESIIRLLISPRHFKNDEKVKWSAFKPPPDSNEISVLRFDYTADTDWRHQGEGLAGNDGRSNFRGYALFLAQVVEDIPDCSLQYAPTRKNPTHANIIFPFKPTRGEPLLPNQKRMIDSIVRACEIKLL